MNDKFLSNQTVQGVDPQVINSIYLFQFKVEYIKGMNPRQILRIFVPGNFFFY